MGKIIRHDMGPMTREEVMEHIALNNYEEDYFKDLLTNNAGIALIKYYEGYSEIPYLCPANVATIGYGTTVYPGGRKVLLLDPTCIKKQALFWLMTEVNDKEYQIASFFKKIGLDLNGNEFSALVSFSYNLGNGPVLQNGRTMSNAIRSKDKTRIAKAFLIYNKARVNGKLKVLKGLKLRRKAEQELFLKPGT